MKIVLTGSLGNISSPLAKKLVGAGHEVVVISSKPDKIAAIEGINAVAAIGSIDDVEFLTSAFVGADAVYLMEPPNYFYTGEEPISYYVRIGQAYAEAVRRSGVKHVVGLSSFGAHLDHGTGFILGSHHVEKILNELPPTVTVTHLRPTSFYYNMLNFIDQIKFTGQIAANYGGDRVIPMVAPVDIAAAAAEELTATGEGVSAGGGVSDAGGFSAVGGESNAGKGMNVDEAASDRVEMANAFGKGMKAGGEGTSSNEPGRKVRYVCSEELTGNQAAAILGAAIGKPDLRWNVVSDDEARAGMLQHGLPPLIVDNIVELYGCLYSGKMAEDYMLHKPVLGPTKFSEFAKDFAAAYHSK